MRRGKELGLSAGIAAALLGGAAGASGSHALGIGASGFAAGMIAGLLFTRGNDIRVSPRTILRIKFLQPVILSSRPVSNRVSVAQIAK